VQLLGFDEKTGILTHALVYVAIAQGDDYPDIYSVKSILPIDHPMLIYLLDCLSTVCPVSITENNVARARAWFEAICTAQEEAQGIE
jgi:hypothetical protein